MDYYEHSVPVTEDRVCIGFLNNNYLLITTDFVDHETFF